MPAPVVVAEIVRSGYVEGHHYGSVAALDAEGALAWSVGDVDSQVFPRSCNKPVQALAMLRAGLDLDGELLALACASHSGESFHIEGVRKILARAGLDESALQTPPDYPLDDQAAEEVVRGGGTRTSIAMNCSGKHAAMLATCVTNGWDTSSYLAPDHPLQAAIQQTFAELTGEKIEMMAVDGCGAPLLSTSLSGLGRAFRTLALAVDGPEEQVARAIRTHPEYVSGSRRDEAAAVEGDPRGDRESRGGVLLRGRAARRAGGCAEGRRRAPRARPVVMSEALRRLEVGQIDGVDARLVDAVGESVLLGGGSPVGEIRAAFGG